MPSRRTLLATTVGLATASLAGCSSATRDDARRHYVDMMNGTDHPHVFDVTVANEAGESLFDHEYHLAAGTGDENRVVEGTPAEVVVVVDDAERVTFPWAPEGATGESEVGPDGCPDGTTTSLTIWYGLRSEPEVTPVYDCETVT